jgi:hypothetical protein
VDLTTLYTAERAVLAAAAVVAAVGLLWRPVRSIARLFRALGHFLEDWNGTPARPGHDQVLPFPERMRLVEDTVGEIRKEVFPNGGASLRDAVTEVRDRVAAITPNPRPPSGGS